MPPASPPGHVCPDCGKSYKAKETLTRHRKNHDPTPQYKCHLCTSSFRRRDLLSRHIATHESKDSGIRARRAHNAACERCFQRKLRCDGLSPCDKCAAGSEQCVYSSPSWLQAGQEEAGVMGDTAIYHGQPLHPAPAFAQQQQSSNYTNAWLGMDDLSLEPMNVDSGSSWPWLYEQMYMQNEGSWPGYAGSVSRLSQSPMSERANFAPGSGPGGEGGATPDALMQDFVDRTYAPFAHPSVQTTAPGIVGHTYPSPPGLANGETHFRPPPPRPQDARPSFSAPTPLPNMSEQREHTLARIVQKSLEYAKDPSLGIWNKKQVSAEISGLFDFGGMTADPTQVLQHLVGKYFEHFYMLWPFLHKRTLLSIDRDGPYLFLTMSVIGAAYAGEHAWPYHRSMINSLREGLLASCFTESMPHHQLEYLACSLEMLKISYMYFGHASALSRMQTISGALVYLVQRLDLLGGASLTGQVPFEGKYRVGSRQWIRSENRKHLAIACLMLENDVSLLFGTRPLVTAEDFGISLPCPIDIWTKDDDTTSAKSEEHGPDDQPLYSELVQIALDVNEPHPQVDPFGMALIMHGFQDKVWRYSYEYGYSSLQRSTAITDAVKDRGSTPPVTPPDEPPKRPTNQNRSMKMFMTGREALIKALKRWRQVLVTDVPTEKAVSQRSGLLISHVLFHLSFMKLLAPLSAIHRLFLDTCQGTAQSHTLKSVLAWVHGDTASEALHHALTTRSILYAEVSRPHDQRARFNILPQFGLFHGAVILWALSGALGDKGPIIPDAVTRQEVEIQQETAQKLLQSFARLLHQIGLEWNGMSTLVATVRDMTKVKFPKEAQAEAGG